jgi:hypothetical protein
MKPAGEHFIQANSTSRFDIFLMTGRDYTSDEHGHSEVID